MSGDGIYGQKLAEFKSRETPEAVLLLADASDLVRLSVAWATTAAAPREQLSQPPRDGSPNAWWNWLWENTQYSRRELLQKADLSDYAFDRRMPVLIGNRIIYPDGTVNSFVQRYLRDKVLKLFQAKGRKTSAKKE